MSARKPSFPLTDGSGPRETAEVVSARRARYPSGFFKPPAPSATAPPFHAFAAAVPRLRYKPASLQLLLQSRPHSYPLTAPTRNPPRTHLCATANTIAAGIAAKITVAIIGPHEVV